MVKQATAELLMWKGASVVQLARYETLLAEVVAGVKKANGRTLAITGNVTDEITVT